MPTFKRPGRLPFQGNVYPHQAFALIEEFRRWIGHQFLADKRSLYRTKSETKQGIAMALLRENQPMIDAFDRYESITFGRQRVPKNFPDNLGDLANVASQYSVVGPTLDDATARHHRHSVVGAGYRSTLLEWKTASALARTNDALIAWLPPSSRGPEFIARAEGQEFEVECKYVSHMITELFGDSEAATVAHVIFSQLQSRGLSGEVHIEVTEEFAALSGEDRVAVVAQSLTNFAAGNSLVEIAGQLRLASDLRLADGFAVDAGEWRKGMMRRKEHDARAYGHAVARPPCAVDPITLYMTGPRRGPLDLLNHVWEVKFKKAAEQCSGDRGAVLAFEWEGIGETSTFVESDGMQDLLSRTFSEFPHIAAVVMRCDNSPTRMGGVIDYTTQAYITRSNVTKFPRVAELLRFDCPLP